MSDGAGNLLQTIHRRIADACHVHAEELTTEALVDQACEIMEAYAEIRRVFNFPSTASPSTLIAEIWSLLARLDRMAREARVTAQRHQENRGA